MYYKLKKIKKQAPYDILFGFKKYNELSLHKRQIILCKAKKFLWVSNNTPIFNNLKFALPPKIMPK